jgi:hypothetical protein
MGLFKRNSISKTPAPQAPESLLGDDAGLEETKPIISEGVPTDNVSSRFTSLPLLYLADTLPYFSQTSAKRPPKVVAQAWQEYGKSKRQFAEDEKNEERQLTQLEKGLKELEKAEGKAHKVRRRPPSRSGRRRANSQERITGGREGSARC